MNGPISPRGKSGLFRFVVHTDERQRVGILLDRAPDRAWVRGRPRIVSREGFVRKAVAERNLPAGLKAWKGRTVHLYGPAGRMCAGKIARFVVVAMVQPHFGTINEWEGRVGGRRRSDAFVASAIWNLADESGGTVLVGELDVPRARCAGAIWGRDSARSVPTVFKRVEGKALAAKALKLFRKLVGVRKIQKEFAGWRHAGRWENHDNAKRVTRVFIRPGKAVKYVAVSAASGRGCGDFFGQFWALWEVRGSKFKLLTDPESDKDWFVPGSVADVDGDGKPEFINLTDVVRDDGGIYEPVEHFSFPDLDCHC